MITDDSCLPRVLKIDPSRQPTFTHRSGWAFALEALGPLHNPDGVLLDSFIERSFSWVEGAELKQGRIPYKEPWVGIMHNPPGIPEWHDAKSSPQAIMDRAPFRESLPFCRGIFVLSEYLGRWLSQRVGVPVCALVHPTEIPDLRFSFKEFSEQRQPMVMHVGWWLRRLRSIFRLKADRYHKVLLAVGEKYLANMLQREIDGFELTAAEFDSVSHIPFVDNDVYDRFLSKNIVFCDLIDSSANNVIIECIVRNTPLLINRLPAIEEYLGEDYPFYFSTLDEASAKLDDWKTIRAAHEHLKRLPKEQYSQSVFRDSFVASNIFRRLNVANAQSHRNGFDRSDFCFNEFQSQRDVNLTLCRGASGALYVQHVDFGIAINENRALRRKCEELICGLPLSAVRELTVNDFLHRFPPEMAGVAQCAHLGLRRALERI